MAFPAALTSFIGPSVYQNPCVSLRKASGDDRVALDKGEPE
jgi:hypothetical protein